MPKKSYTGKQFTLVLALAGALALNWAVLSGAAGPHPEQRADCNKAQHLAAGKEILLVQKADPDKVQPATRPESPKRAMTPQPAPSPQAPQMERENSKSGLPGEDLERAGTRKMGGQVIRSKEE